MMIKHIGKPRIEERPTLVDCLVCLVLPVLSQFANYLQVMIGVNTSLVALVFIAFAILSAAYRGGSTIRIPSSMFLGIAAVSIVCANSLMSGSDIVDALKPMLLMAFVCLVGPMVTPAGVRLFYGVIIIMSLVITVDVFLNIGQYASAGLNLYNVRASTMVDKPSFTILYALSISLVISRFRELRGNVMRLLAIAFIATETYFGFSVIESKTFLFAVALAAVVLYFASARVGKANVLIPLSVIMVACLIFVFLYTHPDFIPDSVRSLLSNVLGIDISYSYSYGGTYVGRSLITTKAISEFLQHPVVGIGFGNFTASFAWRGAEYTVNQTESSWLSFLAEGGIIYVLVQLALNAYLIIRLYRHTIRTQSRSANTMLLVLVVFAALNVVNDFANNFYWCSLAIAYGLVSRDEESTYISSAHHDCLDNDNCLKNRVLHGSYQ